MNKYEKYIIKSEGVWNTPYIDSRILDLFVSGYQPKYTGGCMAIIPKDDRYVLLGEDDDHYFDMCILNKDDLITLQDILESLAKGVVIKINYMTATSKQTYNISKSHFFNKNYSTGNFKVTLQDRTLSAPLITINNPDIRLNMVFDVSHAADKLQVIKQVLKNK